MADLVDFGIGALVAAGGKKISNSGDAGPSTREAGMNFVKLYTAIRAQWLEPFQQQVLPVADLTKDDIIDINYALSSGELGIGKKSVLKDFADKDLFDLDEYKENPEMVTLKTLFEPERRNNEAFLKDLDFLIESLEGSTFTNFSHLKSREGALKEVTKQVKVVSKSIKSDRDKVVEDIKSSLRDGAELNAEELLANIENLMEADADNIGSYIDEIGELLSRTPDLIDSLKKFRDRAEGQQNITSLDFEDIGAKNVKDLFNLLGGEGLHVRKDVHNSEDLVASMKLQKSGLSIYSALFASNNMQHKGTELEAQANLYEELKKKSAYEKNPVKKKLLDKYVSILKPDSRVADYLAWEKSLERDLSLGTIGTSLPGYLDGFYVTLNTIPAVPFVGREHQYEVSEDGTMVERRSFHVLGTENTQLLRSPMQNILNQSSVWRQLPADKKEEVISASHQMFKDAGINIPRDQVMNQTYGDWSGLLSDRLNDNRTTSVMTTSMALNNGGLYGLTSIGMQVAMVMGMNERLYSGFIEYNLKAYEHGKRIESGEIPDDQGNITIFPKSYKPIRQKDGKYAYVPDEFWTINEIMDGKDVLVKRTEGGVEIEELKNFWDEKNREYGQDFDYQFNVSRVNEDGKKYVFKGPTQAKIKELFKLETFEAGSDKDFMRYYVSTAGQAAQILDMAYKVGAQAPSFEGVKTQYRDLPDDPTQLAKRKGISVDDAIREEMRLGNLEPITIFSRDSKTQLAGFIAQTMFPGIGTNELRRRFDQLGAVNVYAKEYTMDPNITGANIPNLYESYPARSNVDLNNTRNCVHKHHGTLRQRALETPKTPQKTTNRPDLASAATAAGGYMAGQVSGGVLGNIIDKVSPQGGILGAANDFINEKAGVPVNNDGTAARDPQANRKADLIKAGLVTTCLTAIGTYLVGPEAALETAAYVGSAAAGGFFGYKALGPFIAGESKLWQGGTALVSAAATVLLTGITIEQHQAANAYPDFKVDNDPATIQMYEDVYGDGLRPIDVKNNSSSVTFGDDPILVTTKDGEMFVLSAPAGTKLETPYESVVFIDGVNKVRSIDLNQSAEILEAGVNTDDLTNKVQAQDGWAGKFSADKIKIKQIENDTIQK